MGSYHVVALCGTLCESCMDPAMDESAAHAPSHLSGFERDGLQRRERVPDRHMARTRRSHPARKRVDICWSDGFRTGLCRQCVP